MKGSDIPIVLAASLVFADATIVTLALPNLLVDLHTTVYGVAAVLAVYTAALGCGRFSPGVSCVSAATSGLPSVHSARLLWPASCALSPVALVSCSQHVSCRASPVR